MSNATNLSKLANLLDDGTTGQVLVSDGTSNVAFETLNTSNVSEGTNLYFTDERVQTKLGSVSGNVVPDTNVAYDLGSAAYAFKDLYLSGSTINLGSLQLSDNGGSLEISPTGGGSAEPFATQAYVTTQVNNLVDAAPGTLDTLNELAAALGDDANFSTTVTNSIAAKANTADLATVATSGSYNDLTNQPTIPTNNNQLTNGAGYVTSAQLVGDSTVISYSSTSSASANDVMMLNTDGTVTPVEVTTFNKNFNLANSGSAHPETADANDPVTVGTIPDNRNMVIHAYHKNGHLHLRTASYTGSTITYGSEIDTNQYVDRVMIFVDEFDTSKFILFYTKNSNFLYARSGEIVGTSIQLYDNNGVNNNLSAGSYGGGDDGIAGQPAGAQKPHQIIYGHGECSSGNMILYLHYAVGNSYSVERLTWDSSNLGAGSTGTGIDSNMRSQNRVYIVDNETENLHRLMGIAGALPSFDLDPRDPTKFVYSYIKGTSGSDYRTAIRAGTIDWTAKTSTRGNEYELFTRSSGNFHQDAFQSKVRIHPDNSKILTLFSVPAGVGGNLSSGETGALNGWFFERDSLDNLTVFCKGKIAGSSSQVIDYLEYPLRQEQVVISHGSTEPHLHLITRTWNGACEKKILKFSLPASQNLTHNTWDGSTTGSSSQQNATNFAPSILSPNANERVGSTNSGSFINNKQRAAVVDYHIPTSTSKPFLTFTQHTYVESNLDKSKIHGLAATSGTTPDVTTQFGVHSGLSGLTVGSKYYVLDDGTLSTTPDTHNAKIGVAVKATHIALDFIDELTVSDLATYATKAYVGTEIAIKANTADLATVATSGSYNDLTNQPTIPSLSGYATETYVNTATANLVDSAPATLDTLNELAAALGDDANFSTTILAQLGTVSANTISNASNINAVQANLSASASTAAVTVSGGNFYIDGAQQTTISLEPGRTYKFDQSDSTNSSHPLRFSTTSDGTHGGGSEYTTGVTTSGTAGSANAYVQIAIDNSTPALYYYCTNHSGMGAAVSVGNPFNTDELSEGTSNLYYTDARVDARISGGVSANLNITSSPTKKYARLELTADQSISSTTQTILNFNTRSEDTSTANLLTTTLGSGKFIIPAGVTKVRLKGSAQGSSVADQFIIKIMKNGSNAVTTNFDISSTGSDFPAVFTGIESVVEGDYFQVSAYSQTSRTVNAGSLTWFELEVLEGSILDTTVSANVALADLNNVSNAAPADGQALIWNTSQSNWAPANVAAGGSTVSVSDTAPSSPSNGDQWFNSADGSMYVYYTDGSSNQWVSVSGPAGSSVSVGATPPTGAANGDQWFNSDSATLYVYYADGSSSQWVAVSGPIGPAGPAGTDGSSVTVYANIAAFPSSGNTVGDFAFASDTKALYVWDGAEWDRISSGPQIGPRYTTTPTSEVNLSTSGVASTLTAVAVDESGFPITYDWDAYSGSTVYNASSLPPQLTAVSESNGVFTLTPSTTDSDAGVVTFRTKASDGVLFTPAITTLTLTFGLENITGFVVDQTSTGNYNHTVWNALILNSTGAVFEDATLRSSTTVAGYTPTTNVPEWGSGFASNAHTDTRGIGLIRTNATTAGFTVPDPFYTYFVSEGTANDNFSVQWTSGGVTGQRFYITGWDKTNNNTYFNGGQIKFYINGVLESNWRSLTTIGSGNSSAFYIDLMA